MAKLIDGLRKTVHRYDWDQWLDGQPRLLVRGEDFVVSIAAMRTAAYGAAKTRGLRMVTRETENGVEIQAFNDK